MKYQIKHWMKKIFVVAMSLCLLLTVLPAWAEQYDDADTIASVQRALNALGYNCGAEDGVLGADTVRAICTYQASSGLNVDGLVTDALLASLGIEAPMQVSVEQLPYRTDLDYNALAANPSAYAGELIRVSGRVVSEEGGALILDDGGQRYYVELGNLSGDYVEQSVVVCGTVLSEAYTSRQLTPEAMQRVSQGSTELGEGDFVYSSYPRLRADSIDFQTISAPQAPTYQQAVRPTVANNYAQGNTTHADVNVDHFRECTLVDNEYVTLQLIGVSTLSSSYLEVYTNFVNHTDRTLNYDFCYSSVNDCMMSIFELDGGVHELPAKMQMEKDLNWGLFEIFHNGYDRVEKLQFTLRVTEPLNDGRVNLLANERVVLNFNPSVPASNAWLSTAPKPNTDAAFLLLDLDKLKLAVTGFSGGTANDECSFDTILYNQTNYDVDISCTELCINSYERNVNFNVSVGGSKRAAPKLNFGRNLDFSQNGHAITALEDIYTIEGTLHLNISDEKGNLLQSVDAPFFLYPRGEAGIPVFERAPGDSDRLLVDGGGYQLLQIGVEPYGWDESSDASYSAKLYLENNSGRRLRCSLTNISANGSRIGADPWEGGWQIVVGDGKRAIEDVSVRRALLDERGVGDVNSLTGLFAVYDADSGEKLLEREVAIVG